MIPKKITRVILARFRLKGEVGRLNPIYGFHTLLLNTRVVWDGELLFHRCRKIIPGKNSIAFGACRYKLGSSVRT